MSDTTTLTGVATVLRDLCFGEGPRWHDGALWFSDMHDHQVWALGMDGKTLIHPAQVGITNEVFAPTKDQVELARRQIEAFEAAEARGEGVAVVDGKIVENLHVETARALLAKAEAVREREAA